MCGAPARVRAGAFFCLVVGGGEGAQAVAEGRFGDAAFGDDGGDVFVRRDVEGRVRGLDIGGDVNAGDVGDFVRAALFDGDGFARGEREIESGDGRGDVEGDVVLAREDGDAVG